MGLDSKRIIQQNTHIKLHLITHLLLTLMSFLLKTSTNNYGAFKFYGVSGNDNLSLLFHTNNIKLYANGQAVHIGVNINDGNWHHFVRTSNRSTGQEKVYLDGALAFTGNISNGEYYPSRRIINIRK